MSPRAWDGTVRLWDIRGGHAPRLLREGSDGRVTALCFSQDERRARLVALPGVRGPADYLGSGLI